MSDLSILKQFSRKSDQSRMLRKLRMCCSGIRKTSVCQCLGLSAGTVIPKETKEPNDRVLLGALLFGCIVSFVIRNLSLGTYRRNMKLDK